MILKKNGLEKKNLDKNMDYLAMREIRLGLACGIDLTDYYKKGYENSVLREIREAYADDINIDLYDKKGKKINIPEIIIYHILLNITI